MEIAVRFRSILKIVIGLLLLADLAYSFKQHYQQPLDGDMAALILPAEWYQPVMEDPFGVKMIWSGEPHGGPNRYFSQAALSVWFKHVPLWLQSVTDPIRSVYLSAAILKTGVQFILLLIFAVAISGTIRLWRLEFLVPALIITPLFQVYGYYEQIGIIDHSITYVFFYALPIALMLCFYLPFYLCFYLNKKVKWNAALYVGLILLAIILPFSSPLIPGCVLVISLLTAGYYTVHYIRNMEGAVALYQIKEGFKTIPRPVLYLFSLISILCIYSLYLGSMNTENLDDAPAMGERYKLMVKGLWYLFKMDWGWKIMILLLLSNLVLVKFLSGSREKTLLLQLMKWLFLFAGIYLLLLPLGGYRSYRPYIIRYDTFIPITLCCFWWLGWAGGLLLRHLNFRPLYAGFVILGMILFIEPDRGINGHYWCEKQAMRSLAEAKSETVVLKEDCPLMSWTMATSHEDTYFTRLNGELMYYWNILPTPKRYYHE